MRQFTDAELMQRVWDTYQIKNVMGRHAYYHAYDMHDRELLEIWPKLPENRATASFGQNWGYMYGFDNIWRNYHEVNVKNHARDLKLLREADPSVEDKRENLRLGHAFMHCLTAPLIEIAGDGKTAQGMWYAPGHITFVSPEGAEAIWMYERYGADFIREPDGWKLWHLFIGTDFAIPAGRSMAEEPVDQPKFDLNDDDEETNIHLSYAFEAYTSRYNFYQYPPVPRPYETFSEVVSNGPQGNPFFKEAEG